MTFSYQGFERPEGANDNHVTEGEISNRETLRSLKEFVKHYHTGERGGYTHVYRHGLAALG